jgi:hypothetical protein
MRLTTGDKSPNSPPPGPRSLPRHQAPTGYNSKSGRETIEERAMELLENRFRVQFAPENFPSGVDLKKVVQALWGRTTHPDSRGVLLLVMDLSRRAWNGSPRARSFYEEQQRLWANLLLRYYRARRESMTYCRPSRQPFSPFSSPAIPSREEGRSAGYARDVRNLQRSPPRQSILGLAYEGFVFRVGFSDRWPFGADADFP